VLAGGRLVGLLSERDLALIETLHSVDPDMTLAEEAMTQAPYTVASNTPLDEVAATMAEQRYGSAVVMDRDKIVGVFTTTDALQALVELLRPHPSRT
jgi:acetoin utilization protein AcuB